MQLFYCSNILGTFFFSEEESKHIHVLRLKNGDEINLIDGKGNLFKGEIIDDNPKKCQIKILSKLPTTQLPTNLHLAVAPTKNIERFEWFLEKATEIGISEITPLICEKSERKTLRTERLEKILISAMKQSLNLFLPKLHQPMIFSTFIQQKFSGQKFIAHFSETHLKNIYKKGSDGVILIGPEGDFSEKEINLAKENGFLEVSLSRNRLRTETAAVVACHIINLINE